MFKHRRQKLITLFGWAALLLLSLACGIPPPRPTRPFPIPGGPDDDSGTPLSRPDREFPLQLAGVNSVSFNPTGRWMATAGEDGAVAIWDFREVRLALRMRGHSGAVTSVAFAPDGKLLAAAGKAQQEERGPAKESDEFLPPMLEHRMLPRVCCQRKAASVREIWHRKLWSTNFYGERCNWNASPRRWIRRERQEQSG